MTNKNKNDEKKSDVKKSTNDIWCSCEVNANGFNDVYFDTTDGPLGHCWCCGSCHGLVQVG